MEAKLHTMMKNLLFQGITPDDHLAAVRNILGIPDPQRIIMCVAFLNESGLTILNDALAPVAAQTTILSRHTKRNHIGAGIAKESAARLLDLRG